MTFTALASLVSFLEPIAAEVAPPILAAVKAVITAHEGLTADQRTAMLAQLETKLDADQKVVDALTATATPDPV